MAEIINLASRVGARLKFSKRDMQEAEQRAIEKVSTLIARDFPDLSEPQCRAGAERFVGQFAGRVIPDAVPRPALTTTASNSRLRSARRKLWRKADATTRYWQALLDFADAVHIAKMYDVKEACAHPDMDDISRPSLIGPYRAALRGQLLTPAPDVAAVIWKRQKLNRLYYDADKEAAEKAIAEDVAFLDAHPTTKGRRGRSANDVDGVSPI